MIDMHFNFLQVLLLFQNQWNWTLKSHSFFCTTSMNICVRTLTGAESFFELGSDIAANVHIRWNLMEDVQIHWSDNLIFLYVLSYVYLTMYLTCVYIMRWFSFSVFTFTWNPWITDMRSSKDSTIATWNVGNSKVRRQCWISNWASKHALPCHGRSNALPLLDISRWENFPPKLHCCTSLCVRIKAWHGEVFLCSNE